MEAINPIQVMLADDHQMFVQGLKSLLEEEEDLRVISTASDGLQVLEKLSAVKVDVLILDLSMPHLDGHGTLAILKERYPDLRTVVVSYSDEGKDVHLSMMAGAKGYVLKNRSGTDLVEAIRAVFKGGTFFPQDIAGKMADYFAESSKASSVTQVNDAKLTAREKEVISCIMIGMKTKEIADKLCIEASTVETHKRKIKEKYGLSNVTEIGVLGQKLGIVPFNSASKS
jgi:two-component system, NarL family, nitrate/nitrite response regulator NarL